jgi:drug/metabolite transporter (DMT)-like permease
VLLLVPSAAALEPGAFAQARGLAAADPSFVWWLAFNCFMAYAVNLTNFLVTKYTSALTLQVLGNLKGVIAAGASVAIFRNAVTAKGMVGYAITIAGVFAYSAAKRRASAARAAEAAKAAGGDGAAAAEPLIKACHASGGGGGGGGGGCGAISLTADASCKAGVVSGGGLLPTSTQQLQQLSRAFRSSCGSGGSSAGGVTVVVQLAPEQ